MLGQNTPGTHRPQAVAGGGWGGGEGGDISPPAASIELFLFALLCRQFVSYELDYTLYSPLSRYADPSYGAESNNTTGTPVDLLTY